MKPMLTPIAMRAVSFDDYCRFVEEHHKISVEDKEIEIGKPHEIAEMQPSGFKLERTSVWSFPERGAWATHKGDYRGNWPPQLCRNLILRYSKPGEVVLDQMCGSGTTLIECKLLGRSAIGVDINMDAIMLTMDRLNFNYSASESPAAQRLFHGDARNLSRVEDCSIDMIATHPPYAGIVNYSKSKKIEGDLSRASISQYLEGMSKVARESFRVLKPGRYCTILIGDTRKHRHYVPIAFRVMQAFLDAGFILREDITKQQWKVKKSGEQWAGLAKNAEENWLEKPEGKAFWTDFYLIMHEHLFIFRKPNNDEEESAFKHSMKWW